MRVCGIHFVVCVHVSMSICMCMPVYSWCSCQTLSWEVCTVVILCSLSMSFPFLFFSSSHDVLVCSVWMGRGSWWQHHQPQSLPECPGASQSIQFPNSLPEGDRFSCSDASESYIRWYGRSMKQWAAWIHKMICMSIQEHWSSYSIYRGLLGMIP